MFPPFLWPLVIVITFLVFLMLARFFNRTLKKRRLGQNIASADPAQVAEDLELMRAAARRTASAAQREADEAQERANALKKAAQ